MPDQERRNVLIRKIVSYWDFKEVLKTNQEKIDINARADENRTIETI